MELRDYSPAEFQTAEEQCAALQRGLGRAKLWAQRDRLNRKFLLEACLEDKRYDHQCEPLRGAWLWDLIQAVGAQESFRTPIWEALHSLANERNGDQLCQLAGHYAAQGDAAFVQLLKTIVERPGKQYRTLGEDELIQAEREAGLLFVIRVHGQQLAAREWEWEDERLDSVAEEKLGTGALERILQSASDVPVRRFQDQWLANLREARQRESYDPERYRQRERSYTAADVIAGNREISPYGWGMHADEAELSLVAAAVCATEDVAVLKRLLMVFQKRALPELLPRLFELTAHEDRFVSFRAYRVLAQYAHPQVRRFAIDHLATAQTEGVIALFAKNFRSGDETRILDALDLSEDDDRHHVLTDARGVLEENRDLADVSRLGLVACIETPCAMCRTSAAEVLLHRSAAPRWLLEECRLDVSEVTRKLVATGTSSL